jgi:hypothetical protein
LPYVRYRGEEQRMTKWSNYLRGQAVLAERISKTMTSPDMVKEFQGYAASFRRDADAEDESRGRSNPAPID